MSMSLKLTGHTTGTIRIGTRTIVLRGKIGGSAPGAVELSYHATSLDDAIDLNGLPAAITDLLGTLQTDFPTFQADLRTAAAPILAIVNGNPFLTALKSSLEKITATGVAAITDLDDSVQLWLTDILMKIDASGQPTGELALGLAFQLTGVKLLNIELLSAGIMVSARLGT